MAKLRCADYGFRCRFETVGESDEVIEAFGKHTETKHGIDYSKEALMQFLTRQRY